MLFLCINFSLFGQHQATYNIENISTEIIKLEKGLSQNSVRCIFEDHKGYMWFGTWDGLNKYDGTKFLSFIPNNTDPDNSLVQQTVNDINQDEKKRIWVATDGGLSSIDYRSLHFKNYGMSTLKKSDTIHAIFIDSSEYIWVGTQHGMALISKRNDALFGIEQIFKNCSPLDHAEIRIIKKHHKSLWIGTGNGLFKLDFLSKKRIKIQRIPNISDPHITAILFINDSLMLIGTEQGLNRLSLINMETEKLYVDNETEAPNSNVIMSLMKDETGQVWIGTSGNGIYLFDYTKETFKHFALKPTIGGHFNQEQTDYDTYINCIYQSSDGILWVGMAWRGFMKINKSQNIFKSFQKNTHTKKGLSDNHIWCFAHTDTTLLIGTEAGVNIYNFRNHRFSYLTTKNGLSSNQIRSIFISSDSCIWIGTYKGGLNRYKPSTGKIQTFKSSGDAQHYISDNTIWCILEDKKQQLWFGTYNGLNRYDLRSGEMKTYYSQENDSTSLSSNIIYCSLLDSNQDIWFGTYQGLNKYHPQDEHFTRFMHKTGQKESLSNNRIFSIYDDLKGNLWIGTVGGGLNQFDKHSHRVKCYTTKQGLPNNVVYGIIPDKHDNIWLSTNYGICRFNLLDKSIIKYSVNDGLLSNELNKGASMMDNFGNIYFGGMFGFNVFSPDKILKNIKIPHIVITTFEAYNTEPVYDLKLNDTINLDYTQNDFVIRYAVLDYTNPQKNLYKHRLVGYDRDWVNTDAFYPIASYSRMEPGHYTFQIMGANNDGIWNPNPFSIYINIKPPWYLRPLFYIPLILLSLVIVFLIIRSRILHFKNQHAIEKQLLNLERQALRLQMNPHFIFNTLNSIQAFILKNKTKESIGYLSKFSRLVRAILNTSKEPLLSLEDEINILNTYLELEQLRFEHRFDFEIKLSPDIDAEFLGIAPMLIQPYVENAVIHGVGPLKSRKGEIRIEFELENEFIKCIITDNGVGRSYHQINTSHKSKGMKLTKERLQILNRQSKLNNTVKVIDLYDKNSQAIGTRIILFITFEEL